MGHHPFRIAGLVAAGLVAVVALAAVGVFLYLRSYTPLDAAARGYAPGPGLGADVEPTFGSGGKPVFIPGYKKGRPFDTAFTLENTGRFRVTVKGLSDQAAAAESLQPAALLLSDSATASADPGHVHRFHRLQLDPGDTAVLVVRWQLTCGAGSPHQDALSAGRHRSTSRLCAGGRS